MLTLESASFAWVVMPKALENRGKIRKAPRPSGAATPVAWRRPPIFI